MKRWMILVAVVVMLFQLTACSSSQYKKAVEFYEAGEFDAAEEIFKELGDYQDTLRYLESMPWDRLVAWLEEEDEVVVTDKVSEYTVSLSLEDDDELLIEYELKSSMIYHTASLLITRGEDMAAYEASSNMTYLLSRTEDEGTATVDMRDYERGDELKWDSYSSSGTKVDGTPMTDNSEMLSYSTTDANMERMLDGAAKMFEEADLPITLADLGFTSYEN